MTISPVFHFYFYYFSSFYCVVVFFVCLFVCFFFLKSSREDNISSPKHIKAHCVSTKKSEFQTLNTVMDFEFVLLPDYY